MLGPVAAPFTPSLRCAAVPWGHRLPPTKSDFKGLDLLNGIGFCWRMAKLRDLVTCLATELDIPLKSMNVLAAELRKAGLIRSTGRGLSSAEMGASDATNLILAALSGAYATQSADAVRALRAGQCTKCWIGGHEVPPPPIPVFDRLPWPHTLGEFLDGYIEDHIRYGDIPIYDWCITAMSFELRRTSLQWAAEIWITEGNHEGWTIVYPCSRPQALNASPAKRIEIAKDLLSSRGSGMRSVAERVMDGVFFDASLCIQGEYPDGADEQDQPDE